MEHDTWKDFKDFFKWRDIALSTPDKEHDHPNIRELRRRIVDLIEETHERNLF